jgi:adhesin/invasin
MRRLLFPTILLFMLCCAAPARAASLAMRADPANLSADQDATVTITISLTDGRGKPLAGKKIFVSASRGTVSGIKDMGQGRYQAAIEVPAQPAPRRPDYLLVMASALLDNEAPAAGLAVPVSSNLVLQGNAAPGVSMRASAAGRNLGEPVTAGTDGKFRLVAPVPPGVASVTVTATRGGSSRTSTVSVDTGNLTRHLTQAVPDKLVPGGAQGFLNVFAVQATGNAESANRFTIVSDASSHATGLTVLGGGVFQSRVSLEPQARAPAEIVVEYAGASRSVLFSIAEQGLAAIALESSVTQAYPGQAVALSLTAYDFAELPAPGAIITMFVDGATAGQASERGAGAYSFDFSLDPGDTRRDIAIYALGYDPAFPDTEARSPELRIAILEPDIKLTAEATEPRLDAGRTAAVRVRAESRTQREGVEGIALQVHAETGSAGPVRDIGGGAYEFEYTAPNEFEGRSISIAIRAPDAAGAPQAGVAFEWLGPGAPFGEARQMEITASAATVPAGGSVTLTARLTDAAGRGVPGRTVAFSSDAGIPGAVTDNGDGSYSAQLAMPGVAPSGAFGVRAACDCGGAALSAQTTLTVPPKPPATISMTADHETVHVSSAASTIVRVLVTDNSGQAAADQAVTLTVSQSGTIQTQTLTTDSSGQAAGEIELTPAAGQTVVTGSLSSNPSISASLTIQKIKYAVSRLELTALPQSIPANGAATLDIEAYAIDETGTHAAGERIEFRLNSGSGRLNSTNCTTGGDGRCTVQYTSGLACGTVSVQAYAYSEDTVRQNADAQEMPAVPASLELNNQIPAQITANGAEQWTMRVLALDSGQCPVAGETLNLSMQGGSGSVAAQAVTDALGEAAALYTAGLVPGDATILARSRTAPLVALSTTLTLLPWQPSSYDVSVSTQSPAAGVPFTVTVTARDYFGDVMTEWDASDLAYSMSGPSNAPDGTPPSLPAAASILSSFSNGSAVFNVTLFKAETTILRFTDGKVTAESPGVTVAGAAAVSFDASANPAQTAGAQFLMQVTARDVYGNVATYDPSGKTFTLSGAAASPDGFAPSYPSSAATAASFSSSTAALPVTLFKAETASLSISDGSITGTTGAITVARVQASLITVVQNNNQSQIITQSLAQNPVVRVSDAYGNPVAGAAVSFAVTGGGGSAIGLSQTTDASGLAAPGSWTMGPTIGANTMTATFTQDAGGSVTINASAFVPSPNAVITLESHTNYICPNDTVDLTGENSTASAVSSLTAYSWNFSNALGGASTTDANPGLLQYTATATVPVTLTVTDNFSQTDSETYYVYVDFPPSPFTLSASPATITADGVSETTITSSTIYGCGQAIVADGTLFTVAPSLGAVTSPDQSGLGGVQRQTTGGVIQFTVRSGTEIGTSVVVAQSVEFSSLNAYTPVTFTGPDTVRPFVASHSPSGGNVTGLVNQISIVFSEDVNIAPDDIRVKRNGSTVSGVWNYTNGNYTAVFTPDSPINADGATIDVTVRDTIADLAGNRLDGQQTGANSEYEFSFGGEISSTPPVIGSCNAAPATFSPDPTDGLPNSSHIAIPVTDDAYIKYWRADILSGGATLRSYVQYNACSCGNLCASNTIACGNCCSNNAAPPGCCTSSAGDVEWDGKNASGDFVANGVYDYRVTAYDLESNASAACDAQVTVSNPIDFGGFGP